MTSVERVVEYTEVKSEAPWNSQQEPPPDWPNKGQVTFNQVNMSYSPNGPLVLKDISFTLQPNEKVRLAKATVWAIIWWAGADRLVFCESGRCRGSNWCWKEFSGLGSVPSSGAWGKHLHRWSSDIKDRPPSTAPEDVHHSSGKRVTCTKYLGHRNTRIGLFWSQFPPFPTNDSQLSCFLRLSYGLRCEKSRFVRINASKNSRQKAANQETGCIHVCVAATIFSRYFFIPF